MRSDRFLIDKKHLHDIAAAIRTKLGTDDQYRPAVMAEAILQIETTDPTLITKEITANGSYAAADDDADGYSSVTVAVPAEEPTLITKEITANGTYTASDDNADGYSEVTVDVLSEYESNYIETLYNKLFEYNEAYFLARNLQIYPVLSDSDNNSLSIGFQVSADNTKPYVVYAVVKASVTNNRIISVGNSSWERSTLISMFVYSSTVLNYYIYGSSNTLGTASIYNVMALVVDPVNLVVKFYINGVLVASHPVSSMNITKIQLNGTDSSYVNTEYIKHFAVITDGVDTDELIISNMQNLMSLYGITG